MPEEPGTPTATEAPPAPPAETPPAPEAPQAPEPPTELARPKRSVAEQRNALRTGKWQPGQQPRDESGRFQKAESTEAGAEVPPEPTEAKPEAKPQETPESKPEPTEASPAPAAEVPEGYVRLEVPEGHPLRARGAHRIVPKQDEEYFRWAMNNHVRESKAKEAERRAHELDRQLQETRQESLRRQAELNALKEQTAELYGDPKILERAREIRETWGDEDAERYLAGALSGYQDRSAKAYEALTAEEQTRVARVQAQDFTSRAEQLHQQRYPGWSPERYRRAIVAYGAMLEATDNNNASIEDFQAMTDAQYYNSPEIRDRFKAQLEARRQAEREKVRQEEAERLQAEEKQRVEEAERNRQKYPFMRMAREGTPARVGTPHVEDRPASVVDQKKRLFGRGARRSA